MRSDQDSAFSVPCSLGREPCANNSGGYCKARAQLSEEVLQRLATRVASGCEKKVSEDWLWKGRHVKLADGTTVSMPDTEENQEEYPQQAAQEEGLGFPVARMVVLLSLASAMVCGMAIGPYSGKETGELALMRQLLDQLNAGDILLTDKYFCSYFMIALLLERNIDFVARLHHARKDDAYRIKRLGKKDYLIEWQRPQKPAWMDQETYDLRARAQKTGASEAETVRIDRSALAAQKSHPRGLRPGSVSTWAMLIKRVYEVDPLACPYCCGQMKIVSFPDGSGLQTASSAASRKSSSGSYGTAVSGKARSARSPPRERPRLLPRQVRQNLASWNSSRMESSWNFGGERPRKTSWARCNWYSIPSFSSRAT